MLNVLILVPEITKGMKSLGPKALLQIKKHTNVLQHQIKSIKSIDKTANITIATGFEADKIKKATSSLYSDITYIHNSNYQTTNQSAIIIPYIHEHKPENLLIISNGILFKQQAITKQKLTGYSKIFILDDHKENFNLGCAIGDSAEYIFYGLPELWSECVYLNNLALELLTNLNEKQYKQMYLFELINLLIAQKTIIKKTYINTNKIMKIVNRKDLTKAKVFI